MATAQPEYPYPLDGTGRLAEATAAVEETRVMICSWIAERSSGGEAAITFGRFSRHFVTLRDILEKMLDAIEATLRAEPVPTGGEAYERSRTAERRVGKVRSTFRWYSAKYEQREVRGLGGYERLLLAADELVRSCFDPPFIETNSARPPDPLCYLDESFDPTSTPRVQPPVGIPAGDEVVGEFVRQMPIPTIALPVTCLDKPWWLAVAAHEVGHHVYFDLAPNLADVTHGRVAQALAGVDDEIVTAWHRWSVEAFADTWSVLTLGSTLGRMVGYLSAAAPDRLVTLAGGVSTYPPPLVRLALFGELASQMGLDPEAPSAADVIALLATAPFAEVDPLAHDEHSAHLAVVPRVAKALLGVECAGVGIKAASGFDAGLLRPGGVADSWAQQLFDSDPFVAPMDEVWSARILVAAAARHAAFAVDATDRAQREDKLCDFLLATLPRTGPPGHLADTDKPKEVDAERIADDFVALLFDEVT